MEKEIFVTKSALPPMEEYMDEISSIWETHWLTNMGEKHNELEARLKGYLNTGNLTLFVNGHSALECSLEALGIKGEVITTPFTFASTTHAISRKGLTPVFADISRDDYTLDPQSIEKLITKDTSAILPVHVYGNLCDVDAIQQIADNHNLKVIYDAAHAFGVKRNGVSAAEFGDMSMFSFHATKVFHTIEGGAVCFKDPALYKTLNQWKNFGITGPETVEYIGGNSKMNEFCAAMGICNLRHIDDEIAKRKALSERYWNNLENVPGVKLSKPKPEIESNYAYLPVVFEDEYEHTRDDVFAEIQKHGINPRKYFYPLTSDFECYQKLYDSQATPIAKDVANRVLTLPLYSSLSMQDVDRICEVIEAFHAN